MIQRTALSIVVVVILVFAARTAGQTQSLAGASDTATITSAERAAGPSFDASVSASDRSWILGAIAKSRPEAQRLIGEIDGMTTFRTSAGLDSGVGVTHSRMTGGTARFEIDLDIATLNGRRVVDRDVVVLHELGHAVDFALVPKALNARLEAAIPRTGNCEHDEQGAFGACTEPAERFADTFAKWALRGGVSAVGAGYGVATPASLEDWGLPLALLAGSR